jgi:hypothetical protein
MEKKNDLAFRGATKMSIIQRTTLLLSLVWAFPSSSLATKVAVYPARHTDSRGGHSSQNISVLQTNDLTGTVDGWNSYRELYPKGGSKYVGKFYFPMPSGYSLTTFSQASLAANVRGPAYVDQKWRFHIRNFDTSKWEQILDNSSAVNWVWSQLLGTAPIQNQRIENYFDNQGRMLVKLSSSNDNEVLNLDFLELTLSGTEAPQTEPPSESPTSLPSAAPSMTPTASPSAAPNASPSAAPSSPPSQDEPETCGPDGLLIPLYIWPTIAATGTGGAYECSDPAWLSVGNSAAASKTIAVANPQNGPPTDAWQQRCYELCIAFLQSKGVKVIGYVYTKIGYSTGTITGYRSLVDVTNDVSTWHGAFSSLKVDGIFVDEVSNVWPDPAFDSESKIVEFNQEIISHVFSLWTAPFTRIVLNAGSPYFVSLMQPYFGDERVIAVVRETNQAGYSSGCESGRSPGPWCKYGSSAALDALKSKMDDGTLLPSQHAVLIYDASSTQSATEDNLQFGVDAKVGYHYFVDHNPWSLFPTSAVWNAQVNVVANVQCANPSSLAPSALATSPPSSSPSAAPALINVLDKFTYDLPNSQTSYSTKVAFIDMEDSSSTRIAELKSGGHTVICYFSAGSYENWRSDKNDFPTSSLGSTMDGWAGERWLDIRHSDVRAIMQSRMQRAQTKGCDGVDADNVDGFENDTGFPLTSADQSTFLQNLAADAHALGLLIGLKNCGTLAVPLEPYFDFSVVEECFKYDECNTYFPFSINNKAVFAIEYRSHDSNLCTTFNGWDFSLIFGNYDLTSIQFCP